MAIKVFKEPDRVTVVFPCEDEKQQLALEKILREIYEDKEAVTSTKIEGIVPSGNRPTNKGVDVVGQGRKQTYVRKNDIVKDSRNPYPGKTVYEALTQKGVTVIDDLVKIPFKNSQYDTQIKREMYGDIKKYLTEINSDENLISADLSVIKDIIVVLSNRLNSDSIYEIIKKLAYAKPVTFLEEADENQLRSAARKILIDTIAKLNK